jgi:5-methyltetrahydropteroyltriglutamate--homocysteine methyltransferase
MILYTQEIGSFKKPDYLIKAYNDLKNLKDCQIKALKETLEYMESTGLDNIGVGGEMFRWEMYKHPISHLNGLRFYGQVRSFDNRYYEKAAIFKKLESLENPYLEEFNYAVQFSKKDLKIPVTGPYTLMDWSFNEYYNNREEILFDFAKIVRGNIKDLSHAWNRPEKLKVQIDEPAATTHPSEMQIFKDAMNYTIKGLDIEAHLHVCYSSDYELLYKIIPDTDFYSFNLEYANRDNTAVTADRIGYKDLKLFSEYTDKRLGVGVIDVHTNFVEPVELIVSRLKYALKYLDPEKLTVNPDCGLRTRAREIAYKKLKNMVFAVKVLRKEYGI